MISQSVSQSVPQNNRKNMSSIGLPSGHPFLTGGVKAGVVPVGRKGDSIRWSDGHAGTHAAVRRRRAPPGSVVTFSMADCKYDVVKRAAKLRGWEVVDDAEERQQQRKRSGGGGGGRNGSANRTACHIHWVDTAHIEERMAAMQPWQRINHFPGMTNVARKARLALNLEKMRRAFPRDYGFYPRTWVLPADLADFRTQFNGRGRSTNGGVFLIKVSYAHSLSSQHCSLHCSKRSCLLSGGGGLLNNFL